jgi:2,4-dienoyl-CoA reductase-like NADH-dependent reductase (Old Yellow Enzyme family)
MSVRHCASATGMAVMGVGLIVDPHHAEALLAGGQADLVAIGREALYNPNWALHAEIALGANLRLCQLAPAVPHVAGAACTGGRSGASRGLARMTV